MVALAVLDRGTEDGGARRAGSTRLVADCSAVVAIASRRDGHCLSEKLIFAECWEGFVEGQAGRIDKVAAHVGEDAARAKGCWKDWNVSQPRMPDRMWLGRQTFGWPEVGPKRGPYARKWWTRLL